MFPIPEQFSTTAKSQLEAQLKILNALTSQAFEGAQQVIALNFHAGRTALDSGTASARQLLALKDPRELFAFGTSQAQPGIDSILAYSRQLFGIAAGTQAALLDSAKPRVDKPAAAPALSATPAPAAVSAPVPIPAPVPAAVLVEAAPAPLAKPVEAAKPAQLVKPLEAAKPVAALVELEVAPLAKPAAKVVAKPQLKAAPAAPATPAAVAKPAAPAVKVAPPAVVAAPVAKPAALAAAKNAGKGARKK